MPKYKMRVSDEVTYARKWEIEVEAADAEAAKWLAIKLIGNNPPTPLSEEQVDATPYEAEEVDEETYALTEAGKALLAEAEAERQQKKE